MPDIMNVDFPDVHGQAQGGRMPNDVFALGVLSDWDAALPQLRALAARPEGWRPLEGLAVHAPVAPRSRRARFSRRGPTTGPM